MSGNPPRTERAIGAGVLFREHASFVARFLGRLGVPRSDLDDSVQEVFVVAHRKGGYVPGPAKPRSWLGAIALRIAQANRRARTARARIESLDGNSLSAVPIAADDPGQTLENRRSVARVQRALDTLPDEYRAAFLLFELEGESCESIASVWDVPIGTVYSRLHHARRRFMRAYEAATELPSVRCAGES